MSWEKVKIKEIWKGFYDGPHATPPVSDCGGIFLGISNITPNGHIDLSDIKYISEQDLPKWTKRVVPQGGDIVFSYEATLNLYAIIPENFYGCLGRRMALIRVDENKISNKFLYYYFFSDEWRATIAENTIVGATVDRIPIAKFPEFPISLPPLKEQKRIADILSAYDNLIENNQKQIKLLEEAAQRLYKQWFIDLRYPGHETTPIVDGLPEGWKRCRMDEKFKTVLGGTPSRANPNYWNGNVAWINSGEVNNLRIMKASECITELALEKSATKMMPVHTTVLAITGATLGQVSYTEIETCANQSVVGIIDETELFSMYLYLFVSTNIKSMIGKATGGAQQHINKDIVNEYKIILPEEHVIKKLNIFTAPIFNKIADCYRQIEKLTESRDRLLPRLMNGELCL